MSAARPFDSRGVTAVKARSQRHSQVVRRTAKSLLVADQIVMLNQVSDV